MRRKKHLFADIREYLRLHYAETPRPVPKPGSRLGESRALRRRAAYKEDGSVLMNESMDRLSPPDESEPTPCFAPEPSRDDAPQRNDAASAPRPIPDVSQPAASAPRSIPDAPQSAAPVPQSAAVQMTAPFGDLSERLNTLDESFQEALLRLIDERGMRDSACYKRAGVDRKLFSKIRSNPSYRPSKPTAVAFAIALELDLDETIDFLRKAGYALSHSSKFDVIVEYFIVKGRYNLRELNEALYEFDQPLVNG